MYRSPSGNFEKFLSILIEVWRILICKNATLLIGGDFYVIYNYNGDKSSRLCDLLRSYELHKIVNCPTKDENCIDNVFINRVIAI